jgi:plasmid stabilization system protein ParE
LIGLTAEAQAQLDAFETYYSKQNRPDALRNLAHALAEASLVILNAPHRGVPAPRPYPGLARLGLFWLKRGRYWIAYDARATIIAGIFYDSADIPGRAGKGPAD